jgi:hypothetical protein
MRIRRLDPETVELSRIDPFVAEMLRRIGPSTDPGGSTAAEERLFSSPSGGGQPEFDEEWKSYVEPDLRELFRTAVERVEGDLAPLMSETVGFPASLRIPVAHLNDWINALNQARLSLAARYDVTEEDMEAEVPMEGDDRALTLLLIHFFGYLQECFLREIGEL